MKTRHVLALLFVLLVVTLLIVPDKRGDNASHQGLYPWEIRLHKDGSSEIFGLHLGKDTWQTCEQVLGHAGRLALFEEQDGYTLEGFYPEITRAGLTGRLLINLQLPVDVEALKAQSRKREPMESGAVRYILSNQQSADLKAQKIEAITYISYADLDEEVILQRFGKPTSIVDKGEGVSHYLYPDKGLDIILNENDKEVFQYVHPQHFNSLRQPLHE